MPLIIHWPLTAASFPAWIDEPVSLLDVVPTILQFLGAQPPSQFQGRGLLGLGKQKFLKTAPEVDVPPVNAQEPEGGTNGLDDFEW